MLGQAQFKELPATRIVQDVLHEAITKSASDIHYEPHADGMHVRLRIDGILHKHTRLRPSVMAQVVSHIKVLGHLNLAQRKIPQDGKFRIIHQNREIDIRVATFPTIWGEKVVLRILDRLQQPISLERLGFSMPMFKSFSTLLAKSHGFLLVSGPTGSGKTTTLYAALSSLNDPSKHIITLEDPVEYYVAGITQGQVYPPSGFTFEGGMRALLRQDPDIVMIGEIRDRQTAGIALEASLTGHLVFSTVHTNDAPSVIVRLMDMGVEPFLINAAITGVLAQRLARKLCIECRVQVPIADEHKSLLDAWQYMPDFTWISTGCLACNTFGYKGRIGIFELMQLTDSLRSLIIKAPSCTQIKKQALSEGMVTLMADGLDKVAQGVISLSELMRVVT